LKYLDNLHAKRVVEKTEQLLFNKTVMYNNNQQGRNLMIGSKYGMLTIVELAGKSKDRQKVYLCKCDCGKKIKAISGNLKKGNTKSCGCIRKEKTSVRMSKLNFKHGETNTKLWKTWKGIVERTTSVKSSHYKRYGGAGIGIYNDWKIYENFAKYIGQPPSQAHSIDRINNLKGYEPGNIRWATAKEQAANRKTNVMVMVNAQKLILSDAAKILNISKSTASRWHKQGKLL